MLQKNRRQPKYIRKYLIVWIKKSHFQGTYLKESDDVIIELVKHNEIETKRF